MKTFRGFKSHRYRHGFITFDIEMTPGPPELGAEVNRFDFVKRFYGDLAATGAGVMLACGDPGSGAAGPVAIETARAGWVIEKAAPTITDSTTTSDPAPRGAPNPVGRRRPAARS